MCTAAGCASSKCNVNHLAVYVVSLDLHSVNDQLCWKTGTAGRCRQDVLL